MPGRGPRQLGRVPGPARKVPLDFGRRAAANFGGLRRDLPAFNPEGDVSTPCTIAVLGSSDDWLERERDRAVWTAAAEDDAAEPLSVQIDLAIQSTVIGGEKVNLITWTVKAAAGSAAAVEQWSAELSRKVSTKYTAEVEPVRRPRAAAEFQKKELNATPPGLRRERLAIAVAERRHVSLGRAR